MTKIYAIFIRQFFLIKHNPVRFINIFMWVVIDIVLWGFLTKYFTSFGQTTVSLATVLFGAVILEGFLVRVQQGTMMAFFEDSWSQNFINLFASPLRVGQYLTGLVLTSIFTSTMAFLVTTSLAGLAFGYNILKLGMSLLPFLMVLFVFGVAMGIFASAIVLRFGPAGEWIGWPMVAFISPLAGVLYPVSVLPQVLQYVSHLLPPSYVFESMRQVLLNGAQINTLLKPLSIGLGIAIVYLVIMYFFFLHNYNMILKKGTITRFSASV